MSATPEYDALLLISFGGPEGPDDVMPFLENVLRGKRVPRERMLEVAQHYQQFGGASPINEQNRQLIAALRTELDAAGSKLPIYWGNRNWQPLLADTLRQMRDDGIQHALALVTSSFSSYSGCRQYLEDIERAREEVGPEAPLVDKVRSFYNHPAFIAAWTDKVTEALAEIAEPRRAECQVVFTAHSIPHAMAENCDYEAQLREACGLVATAAGHERWKLVYQSRSGPPMQPWLEPDVCDDLRALSEQGVTDVVIAPIGFISDHMEVIFDLDTEAKQVCEELGMTMVRAGTVSEHPGFVSMLSELIFERLDGGDTRKAIGSFAARPDFCPPGCCRYEPPQRPATG